MTNVVIITNAFPFLPGEQFLEDEIRYWGKHESTVTILPLRISGCLRKLPDGIKVDTSISQSHWYRWKLLLFLPSIFVQKILYEELLFLLKNSIFRYKLIREAVIQLSATMLFKRALNHYVKIHGKIDIVYCYWNDVPAYAACLIKKTGGIDKLVSRIHGYDLYKERKTSGYMPLKWQFVRYFDRVYAISSQGKKYFIGNYNARPNNVLVAPLGVAVGSKNASKSKSGSAHIVSISFCVDVKRVDRIIGAIAIFASKNIDLKVFWTHIGDGPLKSSLYYSAIGLLGHLENISFEFKGDIANKDVRKFLELNPIDVFVNSSESEGVPVSIMEAMSVGIPAVAPDVGGVSNLVSDECGQLLSSNPTVEEIAAGISAIYFHPDVDQIRVAAKEKIKADFNAAKNYPAFIDSIYSLTDSPSGNQPISC